MPRSEPARDSVERRLDAVERALADEDPIERTDRLDDIEDRLAELEAAVQAVRGYVGEVRAINEDVEHRADRALKKAEALERSIGPPDEHRRSEDPPDQEPVVDPTDGPADDRPAGRNGESIFRWG